MDTTNRRDFLKSAAIGGTAVGVSLAAAGLIPQRIIAQSSSGFQRIVYRELGSTGYKVSEVGLGAMNTNNPDLIHAAIDS